MAEQKSIGKSFSWSFLDKITTQGISTIVSIVLARLIDPEHYGIIALAQVVVTLLDAFVNPGICSALVRKKDPDSLDYSTIFWFNCGVSAVLYLLLFFAAPLVERFYDVEELATVIRILAVHIPFSALLSIQNAYVQKNFLFHRYFYVSLFGTLLAGAVGVSMAFLGFGVWALVAYSLGNCIIDALLALVFVRWRPILKFSKERFSGMFSFGIRLFGVKILDLVYTEFSGLAIGKKYTSADLAHYQKGKTFPKMLISNANMALGDVLFPAFSKLQDDSEKFSDMVKKFFSVSCFMLLPLAFGLLACAESFVAVILTEKWLPCVPYIRIMCIYFACIPPATVIIQGLKARGMGKFILRFEICKKIYSFVLILLALLCFHDPLYIAVAAATATVISLSIDIWAAQKYLNVKAIRLLQMNIKTIVSCALMIACVLLVATLPMNKYLLLVLEAIAGVAVYVFSSFVLRNVIFIECIGMIKGKFKKGSK